MTEVSSVLCVLSAAATVMLDVRLFFLDNMIYPIQRVTSTNEKGKANAVETFARDRLTVNFFPQVTQ